MNPDNSLQRSPIHRRETQDANATQHAERTDAVIAASKLLEEAQDMAEQANKVSQRAQCIALQLLPAGHASQPPTIATNRQKIPEAPFTPVKSARSELSPPIFPIRSPTGLRRSPRMLNLNLYQTSPPGSSFTAILTRNSEDPDPRNSSTVDGHSTMGNSTLAPGDVAQGNGFTKLCSNVASSITSGVSNASKALPVDHGITLDAVLNKKTCPPVTLKGFLNYLIHDELSAENLQFLLWYMDYSNRFTKSGAASPVWTVEDQKEAVQALSRSAPVVAATIPRASEDLWGGPMGEDSSSTAARSRATTPHARSRATTPYAHSNTATTPMPQMMPIAKETLPFRAEVERVLANYIHEGAPRELNLNSATKNGLKAAVKRTDHPSIFNEVIKEVKRSLETQGFPNYIKKALENVNSARRACALCIGAFLVSCGVLGLIFSSLGHWNRGWRFLNAIVIVPGFATYYAGNKGMCVVLHGLGHYQIKQWELFEDAEDMKLKDFFGVIAGKKEDQPWVKKYAALSLIRKIFGKEAKVEEPGIQQFHNVEFLKAVILGSIFGVLLCFVVYVLAPIGGFY